MQRSCGWDATHSPQALRRDSRLRGHGRRSGQVGRPLESNFAGVGALVRVGWSHADAFAQTLEGGPARPAGTGMARHGSATRQVAEDMEFEDDDPLIDLLQEIRLQWDAIPAERRVPRPPADWNDSGIRFPGRETERHPDARLTWPPRAGADRDSNPGRGSAPPWRRGWRSTCPAERRARQEVAVHQRPEVTFSIVSAMAGGNTFDSLRIGGEVLRDALQRVVSAVVKLVGVPAM